MKWYKKGRIFRTKEHFEWMNCFTTPAAAIVLDKEIRIYFSSRSVADKNGNFISNSSFMNVDKSDPKKILYLHNKPIINLGEPGTFDEFGTMIAKPLVIKDMVYLYYMGWQRLSGKTAPYQVMLGLAVSTDQGLTFTKVSNGPIVGIDFFDPISIGNVSVIFDNGLWKMWYTSYLHWDLGGTKPTPSYNIKYAESNDGIHWTKTNIVAIEEDTHGGVATPSVLKIDKIYHMWFGYRPPYDVNGNVHGYKVGYATSFDGILWVRNDELSGISTSKSGWDSEMICYPHVIKMEEKLLMFYCGNGFGLDGFGYAELDEKTI